MTSVSQIKLYDDGEEVDHSFRKIAQGYRRQYIDCSTSAQKLCHVDAADIQTDHYPIATAENQVKMEMSNMYIYTKAFPSRCRLIVRINFFKFSPVAKKWSLFFIYITFIFLYKSGLHFKIYL